MARSGRRDGSNGAKQRQAFPPPFGVVVTRGGLRGGVPKPAAGQWRPLALARRDDGR